MVMNPRVVNVLGLTHNTRHCEHSKAIQKCSQRKDWIAAPPAEARNDVLRKFYTYILFFIVYFSLSHLSFGV